ncbi:hypothetical protein [Streptomyces sp. NPDC021212]|uniref:hypothetical protein n=1 Tax=Streptomyces sp. NPDC021212 TaxID=3365118 RepID=UPI0037AEB991
MRLPASGDGGGWEPVTAGESGAAVFRSDDGARVLFHHFDGTENSPLTTRP